MSDHLPPSPVQASGFRQFKSIVQAVAARHKGFTLDTNTIIAIEESRPAAPYIRQLIQAHERGHIDVALVASSASEKQKGPTLATFDEFKARVTAQGMGSLKLLLPLLYMDVTYWDYCLWPDDAMIVLDTGRSRFSERTSTVVYRLSKSSIRRRRTLF